MPQGRGWPGGLLGSWGRPSEVWWAGGLSRPGKTRSVGMLSFPQGVLSYGRNKVWGKEDKTARNTAEDQLLML